MKREIKVWAFYETEQQKIIKTTNSFKTLAIFENKIDAISFMKLDCSPRDKIIPCKLILNS